MFKSYFTIALRSLLRHRVYSIINIMGLAIGVAACLLIFLFVRYETSYDNWMPNAENIYRLNYINYYKNGEDYTCGCAPGIAKAALDQRFPEIEETTRFYRMSPVITHDGNSFIEPMWMADPNFFDVFQLPFVEGERATAFEEFSNIVISRSTATKYFGDNSPLGEVLTFTLLGTARDYKIVGVFEDLPDNSEFDFNIIFPLDNALHEGSNAINARWYNTWGYVYFTLAAGTDVSTIANQLPDLVAKTVPAIDDRTPNETIELTITNIRDIHLHSASHPSGHFYGEKPLGSITQVYTFTFIAFLILLIACINFVNLSTARSLQRAKEVSLRKTLGATRQQLIRQFLGENILVAFLGLVVAFGLVDLILPHLNHLLDLKLSMSLWSDFSLLSTALILLLFIGVTAGLYPAFYLSAFRPAQILEGKTIGSQSKTSTFRTSLTIFQFSISITLIIATAVVYSQNSYGLNKDMGFTKENKLVVRNLHKSYARDHRETIAQEIKRLPEVRAMSQSLVVPTDYVGWHNDFQVISTEGDEVHYISAISVDANFFDLYEIPILFGRNFDAKREKDRIEDKKVPEGELPPVASAILNETAARQMGFHSPADAIGHTIRNADNRMEVIGIVPDYHFRPVKEPIRALIYTYRPHWYRSITVSYDDNTDPTQLRNAINDVWKQFVPTIEMQSEFIVDKLALLHTSETKQSYMLLGFSILATLIACLGLYGLAAFTAEQRTKEIAIRKVHGAAIWDVLKLLLLQFSKPVLISNLIAWPAAWYLMTDYLAGFTFRIELSLTYFLITTAIATVIAWITTSYHALKAAQTSPAIVLKGE